ncbi:MAG: phosphosulfolactate synthase [Verrucomicrobiae bacterium]|nr:phosphosulfolactate synthase [Verrucomicrobiae bacterium]
MQNTSFLNLPERTAQPRESGISMVIDSGLVPSELDDLLSNGEGIIDYVKLGWGTAAVTPTLKRKLEIYASHNVPVCFGGTFFEIAYVQGKLDEYTAFAKDMGVSLMEISDGSIEIPTDEKLRCIARFANDFKVLSEFGSKDVAVVHAPSKWVRNMKAELEAGAWKSIAEGRESGTAGMYRDTSELRTGLVDEIVESIPLESLLWEAPQKHQQAWFIKKFGPNVNLGNIAARDVIPLETLRLGLRGDTLMHFHGKPVA